MTHIGCFNELRILKLSPAGALLDGGRQGEILLPAGEVPPGSGPGAEVRVFVYHGPEDRLLGTSSAPAAQVGEVACLKIVSVNDAGAFLNWGLPKDLLLPWAEVKREQKHLIVEGRKLVVAVFQAEDGRVAASARLDDFIKDEADGYQEGDAVQLLVTDSTDLGLRVIVDHRYWGLVHANEVFGARSRGQRLDGYVKALRPDRKLNITLSRPGRAKIGPVAQGVLTVLERAGGFLPVTDKTPPEDIYARFGVSKKVFKQTLGALYKSGAIVLAAVGIRIAPGPR